MSEEPTDYCDYEMMQHWKEKARRYCENSKYWLDKFKENQVEQDLIDTNNELKDGRG